MTFPGQGQSATANVILNANVAGYNQSMAQAAQQTGLVSRALASIDQHLTGISGRMGHGVLKMSGTEFAYLGVATGLAAGFEKQLGTLSAQSVVTGQSMGGVKGSVENSFSKFPVSRASVIALTESLTTLGVQGPAALNTLTQTFIKLGAATGEGSTQLAQGLVQLSRLMGTTNATEISNYANALLTVSAKAGVSATSVLNFSQAIAPLARQAGIGTTAVLGISTAFSKAGADGFVAANTFNTMISQITALSASGSPELSKYANLIGVTVAQFKSMDKTSALTQIFEAINKQGPAAIDTLNRLGFDGVRSLSAIQAVASSGDLRTQVATALGSSANQDNLNKASKTAFGGLVDAGAQLKNTFTQTGTTVGTTFLAPLTVAVKAVNFLAGGMRALVPLKTVIGVLAATFGLLAGAILLAAAAASKLALISFIGRSGPVGSLIAGFRYGQPGQSPVDRADYTKRSWNDPLYRGGQQLRAQTIGRGRTFLANRSASQEAGAVARDEAIVAGGGVLPLGRTVEENAAARQVDQGTVAQRLRGGTMRGGIGLINTQREFVRTAFTPTAERGEGSMPQVMHQVGRLRSFFTGTEPGAAPVDMKPRTSSLGTIISAGSKENVAYNASIKETMAAQQRLTAADLALGKATASQTAAAIDQASIARKAVVSAVENQAALRKEAETADAAAFAHKSLARQAATAAVALGRLQFAAVRGAVATVASAGASVVGGAANAIKGIGLLGGAMIGIPIAMGIYSAIASKGKAADAAVGANLNPITKYNDQLGIATTNLASFSTATAAAVDKLNGVTAGTNLSQAKTVSDSDVNNAQAGKTTDKAITGAYKKGMSPGAQQNTIASLLPAYDLTDPRQVQLVKNNLLSAGFDRNAVQNALQGNTPAALLGGTKPMSFGTLPGMVAGTEGKGLFANNTSKTGSAISDAGATQIGLAFNGNSAQFGSSYAGQKRLQDEAAFTAQSLLASPDLGSAQGGINAKQSAGELEIMFGGSRNSYLKAIESLGKSTGRRAGAGGYSRAGGAGNVTGGSLAGYSQDQLMQLIIDKVIPSTDQGSNAITNLLGIGGTTSNVSQMPATLAAMLAKGPGKSTDQVTLGNAGALGGLVSSDQAVLAAKTAPGDTGAQAAGVAALLADATSLGGGFAGISASLDTFMKGIGDTTSQFYILAQGAKALNDANMAAATASMNRAGQFRSVGADYLATATGQAQGVAADTPDVVATKKAAYDQAILAQQQFQVQAYQSLLAYQVQVGRAQDAFDLQQTNARRDFNIQQTYALKDQQKQVLRANQDFAVQLAREAQSNAQTIYDPFNRVEAKQTESAGTLLGNLGDQNARIAAQMQQLQQLRKMGVSQQSIDTLDLSNPANAQQTNTLVQSLANDPSLVQQINAAVATRLKATTSLTQSAFSMQYRNTTADFALQISRGAADFQTASDRAIAAQQLSLSDMRVAFNINATNTAADFAVSMKNMLGNFGDQVAEATKGMSPLLSQLPIALQNDYRAAFTQIATDAGFIVKALGMIAKPPDPGTSTTADRTIANALASHAPAPAAPAAPAPPRQVAPGTGGRHLLTATGGIALSMPGGQNRTVAEAGSDEAIIPLNDRGVQYMAAFANQVSMAMVRQMHTSQYPGQPSGQNGATISYTYEQGTNFTGPVSVAASDPDAMAKALAAKARLAKLSRPARSAAG